MNHEKRTLTVALIFTMVFSGALGGGFFATMAATSSLNLARPRWNVPVIRMANESFELEIESTVPLSSVDSFSALITSEHGTFPLSISDIKVSGKRITALASFPSNVVPDVLYNLSITVGSNHDEQPHAVKIVSNYKSEFKAIFWADTQLGYSPEYEQTWNWTESILEAMVEQANLINPEFIVLLGDVTETALHSEYALVYEKLMKLHVPVYVGTGNHDYFGTDEYRRWMRYYNFTFDYGPDYHFIYIDTGLNLDALREQYITWLADDLAAHSSVPVKIVGGHAPPYECQKIDEPSDINRNFERYRDEFIALLEQYNVPAYFYGHNHQDRINYPNCTVINASTHAVVDGSTWMVQTNDGKEDGGYRVVEFKDRQLMNITAIINATTGARDTTDSYTARLRSMGGAPGPRTIEVVLNDTSQAPAAVAVNVTNRLENSYFTNLTLRVTIAGTNATLSSDSQGTALIRRVLRRTDMANASVVEINFFLPANTTRTFEVTSA